MFQGPHHHSRMKKHTGVNFISSNLGGGGDDPRKPFYLGNLFKGHYTEGAPFSKISLWRDFGKSIQKGGEGLVQDPSFLDLLKRSSQLGLYLQQNTNSLAELTQLIQSVRQEQTEIRRRLEQLQPQETNSRAVLLGLAVGFLGGAFLVGSFYYGIRYDVASTMTDEEASEAASELVRLGANLIRILGHVADQVTNKPS